MSLAITNTASAIAPSAALVRRSSGADGAAHLIDQSARPPPQPSDCGVRRRRRGTAAGAVMMRVATSIRTRVAAIGTGGLGPLLAVGAGALGLVVAIGAG